MSSSESYSRTASYSEAGSDLELESEWSTALESLSADESEAWLEARLEAESELLSAADSEAAWEAAWEAESEAEALSLRSGSMVVDIFSEFGSEEAMVGSSSFGDAI
jgi:hypothetical protein